MQRRINLLLRTAACASILLCTAQTAHADDAAPAYPMLLVDDVKHVITEPLRWDDQDWRMAGWDALAVVGTALIIDRPLSDEMRRHSGDSKFMLQVERFGSQYAVGVVGAFYVAGILGGNDTSMQVANDSLAASLIASGLITPSLKLVVGRTRPRDNAGVYNFRPFSNNNSSFPSGHATEAFALASVISDHYEETWITWASYSVAGLVGMARIYHEAHFASDVVAGAMIGTLVGRSVVSYNQQRRAGKVAILPDIAPGMLGLRLVGDF